MGRIKGSKNKTSLPWGLIELPAVVESVHKEVDAIRKKKGLPRWCWDHKRVARNCKGCKNPTAVTKNTQTVSVP